MKRAAINGVTGQDGIYLTKFLLKKGYEVIGITRDLEKAKVIYSNNPKIHFKLWDMENCDVINAIVSDNKIVEFYNFAALSSGEGMFNDPIKMGVINGIAVTKILEAIKNFNPNLKFCQASSREIFGLACESPQNELTIPRPRSPYGAAKLYADSMISIYREYYKIFCCSAILYNHESPLRGLNFVTRKITNTAVKIKLGLEKYLFLGNLDTHRDWGFTADYVEAMWLMLQNTIAEDFIIGSGELHTILDFCQYAFEYLGLNYQDYVVVDPKMYRPSEPMYLLGDIEKAKKNLNWTPKTSLNQLIKMMIDSDMEQLLKK